MSLVVKKKAGKGFAPKFPQRRPGAPSSAQSSARPSLERQSQTPAPLSQAIEPITIPDDDGTPEPADNSSETIVTTPHPPILENTKDALPHVPTVEVASTLNASAHVHNAALPPDKEGLKRKTRDGDGEVELPHKRPQHSSLDIPKSPSHTAAPVEQSQITETRSQLSQPQVTPLSLPEPTFSESQPLDSPRSLQAETPVTEPIITETSTNVDSSQATTPVPEPAASSSQRHPLPDNTQGSSDGESGPAVTTNGLGPAGDIGSGAEGIQLAQTPVMVPMAPLNPDGTPGEPSQQPATGTKKKPTKRRKVQAAEDGGDVRATVEMQLNRPRRAPGKKSKRNKKDDGKKKNKRAETPEGAENEEINEKEIKMAELCKDLRIGQKFSKHDELRQREKQKLIKAQIAKHPELASVVDGGEGTEGGEAAPAEGEEGEQPIIPGSGPQMKVVDGQIVMDASSMQLDRHGQARATQGQLVAEVENEFSKITTSGTHMKRERAQLWDMASNEIFWKGLRMFGTDFEMISKMFPSRNRRQIKLKFNKEEKDNPAKIDRILKGVGSSIELDTYEELSGVKLEDVAAIEAEREKIEAEQKAEEDRRIAEHAEAEKKKKDAIDARRAAAKRILATADDNGGSGEKENQGDIPPQETGPEGQKTHVWSQTPKAPRGKKGATARKPKKRGAADETVQVLGDA